ncbi:hypothetical protein FQA39_LY00790 [Lamprigera yunnana]|nr:hypothetical protein FQA39_LY00790 [Lamprigera yunnana]
MNSYFEQSGFYGGHHHQSASSAAAHHHDQSAAAAAAYRSFPLSLGMSPYASSQHHHHHSLHQTRPPQDSPYDASVAAACKLYSSSADSQQNSSYSSSNTKPDCSKGSADQNGYASVVAAAAVKDVWQSATTGGGANLANSLAGPVRPAACTPDSRVGYGTSVGLVGGDPSSSPGAVGGNRTSNSLASWNNPCSLNTSSSQPVGTQIHQQTNHTFYPWMAIAGDISILSSFEYKDYLCNPVSDSLYQESVVRSMTFVRTKGYNGPPKPDCVHDPVRQPSPAPITSFGKSNSNPVVETTTTKPNLLDVVLSRLTYARGLTKRFS